MRGIGGLAHGKVRAGRLGQLGVLFPEVLLWLGHLHIGVVAAQRQDLLLQQFAAAAAVVVPVVAVAGLGAVDVPLVARVARPDHLFHQHQRARHHGAAGLGGVEEALFIHLLRLRVVADEDDVDLLVVPCQEQVEQDEEALGQLLATLVHRARHVHEAEHDRLAGGHGRAHAAAKTQVDRVQERNAGNAARSTVMRASTSAISASSTASSAVSGAFNAARRSSRSRSSRRLSLPRAMRRPKAPRIERTTCRLLGVPSLVKPARWLFHSGVSASWVRIRCGRARSSKKTCMNSSLLRLKTKSSSPSPESLASPLPEPPLPPPPLGRSMRSPATYSWLPGCTISRLPPWPWWNTGSCTSFFGMCTSSPRSRSRMPRPSMARRTASLICSL